MIQCPECNLNKVMGQCGPFEIKRVNPGLKPPKIKNLNFINICCSCWTKHAVNMIKKAKQCADTNFAQNLTIMARKIFRNYRKKMEKRGENGFILSL